MPTTPRRKQGCQMVRFQTKNPNLVKFWRGLRLENVDILYGHLEYLTDNLDFYDHLVHFVFIWYIISGLGIMYQEKSGILVRQGSITGFNVSGIFSQPRKNLIFKILFSTLATKNKIPTKKMQLFVRFVSFTFLPETRVARRHIFHNKILIWVKLVGFSNG
jgi:hypothetical protein